MSTQPPTDLSALPLGSLVSDCLVLGPEGVTVKPLDELSDATTANVRFVGAQTCLVRNSHFLHCPKPDTTRPVSER